jgi:hypothetical protein
MMTAVKPCQNINQTKGNKQTVVAVYPTRQSRPLICTSVVNASDGGMLPEGLVRR